jgi:hypothetical protein
MRLQIFTEYSDGSTNTCTHEIDPVNGRSRMKCKDSEVIVINESDRQIVYLRTASRGWVKMERTGLSPSQAGEIEDVSGEITNAQIAGKDVLNDVAVVIYRYSKKIISGSGDKQREYDANIELWVSEVDGLPYRKIVDATLVSGDGQSYKNTTEVTYDVHISIGAP